MAKPLALLPSDFDRLAASTTAEDVARNFVARMRDLHHFLNGASTVRDLQDDRKAWIKPRRAIGFENFGRAPRHWYTYHHGGRNEAQLNVGMFAGEHQHVRVGLGFEATEREFGDPSLVVFIHTIFVKTLRSDDPVARDFRTFAAAAGLEVEFWNVDDDRLETVAAGGAIDFLLSSKARFAWIFIGRLLRRDTDASTLADPIRFAAAIDEVFTLVRPIWRLTNTRGLAAARGR